jgi:DNA-binding SARP family transcriptional activator
MRYLCAKALEEKIEPEYVRRLIGKLALTPPLPGDSSPPESLYAQRWPYPIKIHTLGRFEILKSDHPVHFPGKEQKKPLEMLKVLIAFGGRDVSRERVTDILWPDADGDQANKSFETTLGRLRKLIGDDNYIIYRARQLSLNPLYCWVDALALESILDAISSAEPAQLARLCAQAVGLYKGPFLSAEESLPWVAYRREPQLNRLLKSIGTVGRHYELSGEWEMAAELFSKAITCDDLAEEFYRRLMICYRQMGNNVAAIRTYNRCRSRLLAELGIEPSRETTAVYSAITQQ